MFHSFIVNIIFYGLTAGLIYLMLEYYNPFSGDGGIFGEKFKFDLKTAKDIKTRLADVKGIDEIKAEV